MVSLWDQLGMKMERDTATWGVCSLNDDFTTAHEPSDGELSLQTEHFFYWLLK